MYQTADKRRNNDKNGAEEGKPVTDTMQSYDPKKELQKMVDLYLAGSPLFRQDKKVNEVEIRFGSNKPITKTDYENVVKKLYNSGFECANPNGILMLRIQSEYNDPTSGLTKLSQTRCEINGLDLIQQYCSHNNIQNLLDLPTTITSTAPKIKFTMKTQPNFSGGSSVKPVIFNDFNFRVSYQLEQDLHPNTDFVKNITRKWTEQRKMFRYINRVRFVHSSLPLFADISVVKTNSFTRNTRTQKKVPVPQYTIQDAGVFSNLETYEVEIELDNTRLGNGTEYDTADKIVRLIHKSVRIVLGALQKTNYPVSYAEQKDVIKDYWKLLHPQKDAEPPKYISNQHFIGPSSITLQTENIYPTTGTDFADNYTVPNIRQNYTVTDKADGERHLLYIHTSGKIYMIDTNMNVVFTGMKTDKEIYFNSLLDGEFITQNNKGKKIRMFASFDIYYIRNKSLRELAFIKIEGEDDEPNEKYRLLQLVDLVNKLNMASVSSGGGGGGGSPDDCSFQLTYKNFFLSSFGVSIFDGCSTILANIRDGIYPYFTDGLIFTPANAGVGGTKVGVSSGLTKITWNLSFKWKPPQFNTIDFLVSVKKNKNGQDEINNIFQEGTSLETEITDNQYKTLILRCGFDNNKHRLLNPYQSILEGNFPSSQHEEFDNTDNYQPKPFIPTQPYDPDACICNIILSQNENGGFVFKAENGEYFEEDMIVEFRYDLSKPPKWRWAPIRVRYDKTSDLRSGSKNYGNAFHVANNNWASINNPITEEMITTGFVPESIFDISTANDTVSNTADAPINMVTATATETATGATSLSADNGVYYNRATTGASLGGISPTVSMRNFHNLYVKNKLISGVAERGYSLIDYSVGKAGDLSKWINSKLSFVLGIDISPHNIYIAEDSACFRYLNEYKKHKVMPKALFVTGNSIMNIRNGDAFTTDKDKMIVKAVFGNGPKDKEYLGKGVYANYGVAQDGFNISSSQFSIHYFFENPSNLHGFLANLAECTKLGGYFIGTCFDGKTIFQRLSNKQYGENYTITSSTNGAKICEITKQYTQTGFPDDELSIGYAIYVYQESISRVIREYLVNFTYFQRLMENYGFILAPEEDLPKLGLPNSTGLFDELFQEMENEIKRFHHNRDKYKNAPFMSPEERSLSFMNRYFVFKKTRTVITEKIRKSIERQTHMEILEAVDLAQTEMEQSIADSEIKKYNPRKVKGKKIVITTVFEDSGIIPPPPPPSLLPPTPQIGTVMPPKIPSVKTLIKIKKQPSAKKT